MEKLYSRKLWADSSFPNGVQETVLLVNRAFVPPKSEGVEDTHPEDTIHKKSDLVDVSDIFYFFSARGGEGRVRGERRGLFLFIENPRRGFSRRGEGAREGVCGELGIFFFGGGGG